MSYCQLGLCGNRARYTVAAACQINHGVRELAVCERHARRCGLPRCICGLQLRPLSRRALQR